MNPQPKVAVLLSGCGFYDGTEIQEAIFTLLALDKYDCESVCFAPDIEQRNVVNHLTGEDMDETRNVLVEAARITRGRIQRMETLNVDEFDALIIPGGFGVTKNLTQSGSGEALPEVHQIIKDFYEARKIIGAVCLSPTVLVQVFDNMGIQTKLKPEGADSAEESMRIAEKGLFDKENRILTSPCYTRDAPIAYVYLGVESTIIRMTQLCKVR